MSSSLKKWVTEVPWMQQGVLVAGIRGCDGLPKEDVSKIIVRGYRALILKSAKGEGSFLARTPSNTELILAMKQFCQDIDHYSLHFMLHVMHAAEIVGYKHPDRTPRIIWNEFYLELCKTLHVFPESELTMDNRLKDDPEMVKKSEESDSETYRTHSYQEVLTARR